MLYDSEVFKENLLKSLDSISVDRNEEEGILLDLVFTTGMSVSIEDINSISMKTIDDVYNNMLEIMEGDTNKWFFDKYNDSYKTSKCKELLCDVRSSIIPNTIMYF